MKELKILWMTVGVMVALIACNTGNDTNPDSQAVVNEVSTLVKSGDWVITYFAQDNIDETSNYDGFTFVFGTDGTLTATKNSDVLTGIWSVSHEDNGDDSADDNPHPEFEDIDFNIHFTAPDLMAELSEDWEIVSHTDTKIELKHVSGGDGGVDYLTFEKK